MYLRVTTTQTDPSKLVAAVDELNGSVRKQLSKVAGLKACYSGWNGNGSGVTIAVYESKERADAAAEQIRSIWTTMGGMLTAPPSVDLYEDAIDLKA